MIGDQLVGGYQLQYKSSQFCSVLFRRGWNILLIHRLLFNKLSQIDHNTMEVSAMEKYGITFYAGETNGYKFNSCRFSNFNYVNLSFVSCLSTNDCNGLIDDLQWSVISGGNVDDRFSSDSVEDIVIAYQYPNVEIDNVLTIPMIDLLQIVQEWKAFIG